MTLEEIGREYATLVRREAMLLADLESCRERLAGLRAEVVAQDSGELYAAAALRARLAETEVIPPVRVYPSDWDAPWPR